MNEPLAKRDVLPQEGCRFPLGQVVLTAGALAAITASGTVPSSLLYRHVRCDWGALCASDKAANNRALARGGRLLSAYELTTGERIWIITEADRSATTLLLPEEY